MNGAMAGGSVGRLDEVRLRVMVTVGGPGAVTVSLTNEVLVLLIRVESRVLDGNAGAVCSAWVELMIGGV